MSIMSVLVGGAGETGGVGPVLYATISANTENYTFNPAKVSGYVAGNTTATLTIDSDVYLYSNSISLPALTVSGWANGDSVYVVNNGYIMGRGGDGGTYNPTTQGTNPATNGGDAISLANNMTLFNNSFIGGGGGGGAASNRAGGGGGGGGAGGGYGGAIFATSGGGGTGQQQYSISTATSAGTYAYQFDGKTNGIRLPTNSNLAFGSDDFTIEFWMNAGNTQTQYAMIADATPNNTGTGIGIGQGGNGTKGKLNFFARGGSNVTISSTTTVTTNTWTHIACVKHGANGYVFVNGTREAITTTWGGITSATLSDGNVGRSRFGQGNASDNTYKGFLSNFRIVKGQALYTSNFTVPTSSLTAVANTQLLTLQDATVIDNSTNHFTLVANTVLPFVTNSQVPNIGGIAGGSSTIFVQSTNFNLGSGSDGSLTGPGGGLDANSVYVAISGSTVTKPPVANTLISTTPRGHTLYVINPITMTVESANNYDTWFEGKSDYPGGLLPALANVATGKVVAMYSFDASSMDITTKNYLINNYGDKGIIDPTVPLTWSKQRYSEVFIGIKGALPNTAIHLGTANTLSKAIVNTTVSIVATGFTPSGSTGAGGLGGTVGNSGTNGTISTNGDTWGSGGGGGRVMPGTGGQGGRDGIDVRGAGGTAGGGGGGATGQTSSANGGSGGSAGAVGGNAVQGASPDGAGGGGGWGASGGNGCSTSAPGIGGKCVALNGKRLVIGNPGTLYGVIS